MGIEDAGTPIETKAPLVQVDTGELGIGTVGVVLGALGIGIALGALLAHSGGRAANGTAGIQLNVHPNLVPAAQAQPSGLHAVEG